MQLPGPGGARFEEALAEARGWPLTFAERVTCEYRRFLYLAATAGFEVTPSQAIDEAWHLHLELPHYRETLCGQILGRPLEHRPATGEPGEEERHRLQYEHTTALYERVFLELPPPDIWPPAVSLHEPQDQAERLRRRRSRFRIAAGAAVAAAAAASAAGQPMAALILLGLAAILAVLSLPFFAGKGRGSSCSGGGCGGGFSGARDDADSGSSCGGDCGGGCGGGD
jgi:hypothetical protein